MLEKTIYSLFKKGSRTYFNSSLFFPPAIRKDVFILYGFVRKADNYVDVIPQKKKGFYSYKREYMKGLKGEKINDIVIRSFIHLMKRKDINPRWVTAFLRSMEMDLYKKNYKNKSEILKYMYGSAEVIGLMMAKILNLNPRSFFYARYLGRAMQYINFIRDLAEDLMLGRVYFPQNQIKKFGLKQLNDPSLNNFSRFIGQQIKLYETWQAIAEKGFSFIPRPLLIPIKTASDLYNWTARFIGKNPSFIFKKKVKPSLRRVLFTLVRNTLFLKGEKQ